MSSTTYPKRTGTDRRADFLAVFPTIVEELLEYMNQEGMPKDAVDWFEKVSWGGGAFCSAFSFLFFFSFLLFFLAFSPFCRESFMYAPSPTLFLVLLSFLSIIIFCFLLSLFSLYWRKKTIQACIRDDGWLNNISKLNPTR